ncbi:MAG: Crp/Fnr family transcriptional regulator [Acidiferrobacteraceae bacterium]
MLNRFVGNSGRRLRVDAFKNQELVAGNQELAEKLADIAELVEVASGASIITQDDFTNDIFFILVGSFSVIVNGREVATRSADDHVGEMGAIEPTHKRAATVTATEDSLVAKLGEDAFDDLGKQYPELYMNMRMGIRPPGP